MKGIREFFGSREAHLSRSCTQRFSSNEANHGRQNLRKHWKHRKSGKRAHRLRSSGITSTGSFSTFLCGVLVFCSVSRPPSVRHPLLVLLSHTHTHTTLTHTQHCHTHTTLSHTYTQHCHTHRHTHTSLHTHTTLLHRTLSHTCSGLFHIRLLHKIGPPPSPLPFWPFPSHFHTCLTLLEEVDMWGYPVL